MKQLVTLRLYLSEPIAAEWKCCLVAVHLGDSPLSLYQQPTNHCNRNSNNTLHNNSKKSKEKSTRWGRNIVIIVFLIFIDPFFFRWGRNFFFIFGRRWNVFFFINTRCLSESLLGISGNER